MKISLAKADKEREHLDDLLWRVLWKPLGLPREIRSSFGLETPRIEIVAALGDTLIGGLVANRLSENEIEIRHIAVGPEYQGRGVGRGLVEKLLGSLEQALPARVRTYARNTSVGFFEKLGFKPMGEVLEHEDFAKHGISFIQMYLNVP